MSDATIIHMCLNVADAAASKEFYAQFGFEDSWQFTTDDGETTNYYVADPNGVELQLSETSGETDFEMGTGWDHLALAVDDVDATVERIDHHGIVKEPGPQPAAGSYTAFLKDPDGHVVELVQPADD
jgi:lactoylglutathione lyase